MKKILASLAALGLLAITGAGVVMAQEEGHNAAEPTHFPIREPEEQSWSFAGPFGRDVYGGAAREMYGARDGNFAGG